MPADAGKRGADMFPAKAGPIRLFPRRLLDRVSAEMNQSHDDLEIGPDRTGQHLHQPGDRAQSERRQRRSVQSLARDREKDLPDAGKRTRPGLRPALRVDSRIRWRVSPRNRPKGSIFGRFPSRHRQSSRLPLGPSAPAEKRKMDGPHPPADRRCRPRYKSRRG